MTFTKKTWVAGEKIAATELNRIEIGIDDVYTQDVSLGGDKTFLNSFRVDNVGDNVRFNRTTDKADISAIAAKGMVFDVYGGVFKFLTLLGASAPLSLLEINGVVPEDHALRHMFGGADIVGKGAEIVVDNGGEGDYTTLGAAAAGCAAGDTIYMLNGTDETGSGIITPPANVTIIGSGLDSILSFTGNANRILLSNPGCRVMNIKLKTGSMTANALLDLNASQCVAAGVIIEDAYNGIEVNVGAVDCVIVGCHTEGATNIGIHVRDADHNFVLANEVDGQNVTIKGILVWGDHNRVIGNRILDGKPTGTPAGIEVAATADRNTIEGNTIDDYYYGVSLLLTSTKNVTRINTISNFTTAVNDAGTGNVDYANV